MVKTPPLANKSKPSSSPPPFHTHEASTSQAKEVMTPPQTPSTEASLSDSHDLSTRVLQRGEIQSSVNDVERSMRRHLRVLYTLVTCLAFLLLASIVYFYQEILVLRLELQQRVKAADLVEFNFPERTFSQGNLITPYRWIVEEEKEEEELSNRVFWGQKDENVGPETKSRAKRHANAGSEGSGGADDWLWMSSFSRVPIVALKSYCREAQLYCAAQGPPGPPGKPGSKGEQGVRGEKGEYPDETAIAQNLASLDVVRGPPGPKGDRGPPGQTGPRGPKGDVGRSGAPGLDGRQGPMGERGSKGDKGDAGMDGSPGATGPKGERGYMGPPGERGMSGMPGVPGLKGLKGNNGERGPTGPQGRKGLKGERGHCEVQCLESSRPTQSTVAVPTTPVPTFPPRVLDCSIEIIGKPVFLRETSQRFGSWMQDSAPPSGASKKVWMTLGLSGTALVEYNSFADFKNNIRGRVYGLQEATYFGTGHVVYGGYFYYHWAGQPKIVRYSLTTGQVTSVRRVQDMVYEPTKALKWQGYLYQSESLFVDFSVDKNGLWIIYGNRRSEKMTVALLNLESMDVVKTVELDFAIGSKGNALIVCGKVYTLRHHNRRRSYLDRVHDLWTNVTSKIKISFSNPFARTTMVSYNHKSKQILSWDAGRQLSAPLLLKVH